jgi:hypothetical protein
MSCLKLLLGLAYERFLLGEEGLVLVLEVFPELASIAGSYSWQDGG